MRLRLGRTEVAQLGNGERVEDASSFGPTPAERLVYAIAPSPDATTIAARFAKNELLVTVPSALALEWARGDVVSLEAAQTSAEGSSLAILIEKDFACLKPRTGEDDADAYPNPSG